MLVDPLNQGIDAIRHELNRNGDSMDMRTLEQVLINLNRAAVETFFIVLKNYKKI
jgi:hypothetical protein